MAHTSPLCVGLEVHKEPSAGASGGEAREAEGVAVGTIGTRQGESDKLSCKLQAKGKTLPLVDEAGPWG